MTVGNLILRGLLAGVLAGLVAFGFARVVGEPALERAVQFEAQQDAAKAAAAKAAGKEVEEEEPEVFSRAVQRGPGLLTALVTFGAGLGALFGVLFALANGRIGSLGPGSTAVLLAALAWVTVYLVPILKYPASPPSVGDPDTIQLRTGLYFLVMAISIAATVGAWALGLAIARVSTLWNACVAAFVAYVVFLSAVLSLMPAINEVPSNFPASVLWEFRLSSAGTQLILWGGLGLIFGTLAEWSAGARSPAKQRSAATA